MPKSNKKCAKADVKQANCEICPKPAVFPCPYCNLFNYCSQEHQLKHKNDSNHPHGANCKPIKVESTNKSELKLVTTRKIQDGEVIFREKPLFIGPCCESYIEDFDKRLKSNKVIMVCLGCYRAVPNEYRCTKCNWPVCNFICQGNPWHKDFECEIFARRNVSFSFSPDMKLAYSLICILRFLVLEKKDAKTWKKMLPIFKHCLKMSSAISPDIIHHGEFGKFVKSTTSLLRRIFHLGYSEFDYSKIKGIMLVFANYGISSDYSTNMIATAVFDMGMKITMDCTPNTFPKLDRVHGKGEVQLSVYSLTPLEVGSQLTRIADPAFSKYGTYRRRVQIMLYNHVICKCKRCCDPTEFGTFFTSFKCSELGCPGYLMALNPLEVPHPDLWKCSSDNCPKRTYSIYDDLDRNWNGKFNMDIAQINHLIDNSYGICSLEAKLNVLDSICAKFELNSPNNYFLSWNIRHTMYSHLEEHMDIANRERNTKLKVQIAQRILGMATNLLKVANIICPGLTPARAKLMYYTYKASRAIMEETEKPDPFMQSLVEKMGLEALRIMKISCPPNLFCPCENLVMFRELECCLLAESYDGISLLFSEQCIVS